MWCGKIWASYRKILYDFKLFLYDFKLFLYDFKQTTADSASLLLYIIHNEMLQNNQDIIQKANTG